MSIARALVLCESASSLLSEALVDAVAPKLRKLDAALDELRIAQQQAARAQEAIRRNLGGSV